MSFHPRKVVTTGEGGMCLTNDAELAEKLRILRNHGQSEPGKFRRASGNYRLNEIGAALGTAQLDRLAFFISDRRRLAAIYHSALPQVTWQREPDQGMANYQTMGALVPQEAPSWKRDELVRRLREDGVEAGALSYAIHTLPSVPESSTREIPVQSASIAARGFAIPLFPTMTEAEQAKVITTLERAWNEVIE